MHSLKLFTSRSESDDLIELEEFKDMQLVKNKLSVKSKSGKDGKGTKRKRSNQSEEFPTTTVALIALIGNAVIRATHAPTLERIEKESKCDNSDDESAEELNFSSLNDLSNQETALDFA